MLVALGGMWWGYRTQVPPQVVEGEVQAPPMPVLTRVDGDTSLETECFGSTVWDSALSRPVMVAVTRFSGFVDTCLDVYRLLDEDPAKDYYQVLVHGSWVTTTYQVLWPWQARDEPAGEVWMALTWDVPVAGNYWQTQWVELDECTSDAASERLVVPWASSFAPVPGLECEPEGSVTIGQPEADQTHVTWSVTDLHEQVGTGMLLEIAVPEGEVPRFEFDVRQVDTEG
jgi:hypothetical protein